MNPLSVRVALLGPALIVACHLVALAAIVSFTIRVGEPPLVEPRWLAYPAIVLASAVSLSITWREARGDRLSTMVASAALLPLFSVTVLYASFGGPYGPWGALDFDFVAVWYWVLAAVIVISSVIGGSWRLFAVGFIGVAALYLLLLPAAGWYAVQYGVGDLVRPRLLVPIIIGCAVGAVAMVARKKPLPRGIAFTVTSIAVPQMAAALLLAYTIDYFPSNGAETAYWQQGMSVPWDAWNWLRPAAIAASLLSALAVFGLLCFQLGVAYGVRRQDGDSGATSDLVGGVGDSRGVQRT